MTLNRNESKIERMYGLYDKKTNKRLFKKVMTFRQAMDKAEELSFLGIVVKQEAY